MPTVRFEPDGLQIEVPHGTLLIDAARAAGLHVAQQCGGMTICGWCRMRVVTNPAGLSVPERNERRLFERNRFAEDERAACQAEVIGDLCVTTHYW